MLRWLANRLFLSATRHPIDPQGKQPWWLEAPPRRYQGWVLPIRIPHLQTLTHLPPDKAWVVCKFVGMGGRAEAASESPFQEWSDLSGEVWSFNPPGYGQSPGPPCIHRWVDFAEDVWGFLRARYPRHPIVLAGSSLGSAPALYLAARYPVAGLILRNPPPIRQLVRERWRYNWWNGGAARWIAAQFPEPLDSIRNAALARAPTLFIQSGGDTLVPPDFQERIIERYAGPHQVWRVPGLNHNESWGPEYVPEFCQRLTWLKHTIQTHLSRDGSRE